MTKFLYVLIGVLFFSRTMFAAERTLPRGDHGFLIGDSISELDTRAARLDLALTNPGSPGASRYYRSKPKAEIMAYSMFVNSGVADSVDIIYPNDPGTSPNFESLLESFGPRLGKPDEVSDNQGDEPNYRSGTQEIAFMMHKHRQDAYWCDHKTFIHLQGTITQDSVFGKRRDLSVRYANVPERGLIRIHVIGKTNIPF